MQKEILTFKSGKFVFSNECQYAALAPLLTETTILYKTVSDLPILPALATKLKEDIILRSICGTAGIEGNPLSEEDVDKIVKETDDTRLAEKAELEIRNLKNAYLWLQEQVFSNEPYEIKEETIKKIHLIVTKDIEYPYNVPGNFRNNKVKVGDDSHGGVYMPPKCLDDIKMLMPEYIAWINSKDIIEMKPFLRASLAHYYFGVIHPFADGNGRTGRLVEALLLRASRIKFIPYMLSNYYYLNKDEYFNCFCAVEKNGNNDITAFFKFTLSGIKHSLEEIKDTITFYIRIFTLRDYYTFLKDRKDITQRQLDLLNCLLNETTLSYEITLDDLFTKTPFNILYRKVSVQTARRDLKKLAYLNMLIHESKNKYVLNIRHLDELSIAF